MRVLKAGYALRRDDRAVPASRTSMPRAKIEPGIYRNITGNTALAWGIVAAGATMERPVFLGAYPITPASDVLHELARYRHFGVKTFQAEDEIAAISASIGASFAGHLAHLHDERPGLRAEAGGARPRGDGRAAARGRRHPARRARRPACRRRSSRPTCCSRCYGRNSDSPVPVLAPATPGDCFYTMLEAFRLAVRYMTPVIVLSDSLPREQRGAVADPGPRRRSPRTGRSYRTDPDGLPALPARRRDARAAVGDPGHARASSTASAGSRRRTAPATSRTDPQNHARMIELRAEKVARIAQEIPPVEVHGADRGELLVVGWGGTHGAITSAVDAGARRRARRRRASTCAT